MEGQPPPPKAPGMVIDDRTALVLTDPQNDFLSPDGVTWGVVGKSVEENNTVSNIEALLKVAKETELLVFVSPHFYYPSDRKWEHGGTLEHLMHKINMFTVDGAPGKASKSSGAEFLPRYKRYLEDGDTVIVSPHKVYGPSNNDLCLQLRKRGIEKVILAGMSANLCVEAHMRELLEQGFQVACVSDATAGGQFQGLDGYKSAITNFHFMANAVWTTEDAVSGIKKACNGNCRRR